MRLRRVLMTPQNVFHAVLQLQFSFLEGDFFDLLGFGEVCLADEFVQAAFELVMLAGEVVKFGVVLYQFPFEVMRLLIHAAPPFGKPVLRAGGCRCAPAGRMDCYMVLFLASVPRT